MSSLVPRIPAVELVDSPFCTLDRAGSLVTSALLAALLLVLLELALAVERGSAA